MTGAHSDKGLFSQRRSGILLHPSSLPGAHDEGAFGDNAYKFLDFLQDSGFTVWQMLPINSTGILESPYQGTSVYAGNKHLISTGQLLKESWINEQAVDHINTTRHDIDATISTARACFNDLASSEQKLRFVDFVNEHANWLDDYALYSVIKNEQNDLPWWEWSDALRHRDEATLEKYKRDYSSNLDDIKFEQYVFYTQWNNLKRSANEKGILLFGDMPILVAHDSVDVWVDSNYFKLFTNGHPKVVAGVPPDYFSDTGQRWGNPLYNWDSISKDGFKWWIDRFKSQLSLFDIIRLDHFRGFHSLWEIPADSEHALNGNWEAVPGRELFQKLKQELGELPIVAEDLGEISEEVLELRDEFDFPGMKILMFAFDKNSDNPYLPHKHDLKSVVYTGTHDNNTSLGWFYHLDEAIQQYVYDYLGNPSESMPWPLIYSALRSVCPLAIIPMQDLLGLDGTHRMNTPGTIEGNWKWQFQWEWVSPELTPRLQHLNKIFAR